MNTVDLHCRLEKEDFPKLIQKYHFNAEDLGALQAFEEALQPLLKAKLYYVWKEKEADLKQFAVCFVTLGDGVDVLQELYLDRECVSQAYMLECIASELLFKAYEEGVDFLQKESGKWAERIEFLGDTYPLEWMEQWYGEFEGMEVQYNEQFVLSPKKSVVFLLPVSEKKQAENPIHICASCQNKTCAYRTETIKTYGYERIFGEKKSCKTD